MQRSERKLNERIPFLAENNPLPHEMPCRKGAVCTRSTLIFSGSLVVSGGSSSGTALGENPGNLAAQQVKVEGTPLNGDYPGGTLKQVVPRTLIRRRMFDHSQGRMISDVSLGVSGLTGAAGTFTLNLPLELYWALPWMKRPFDTALDTGMFGTILFTITNGSRDRQFSGNDRTFNYNGVYWDILHEFQRLDGIGVGPIDVLYDFDKTKNISGANPRLEVNKDLINNGAWIDLLTMTETTNQVLADTILNRIELRSGTEEFINDYGSDNKADIEGIVGDSSINTTPRTGLYYSRIADDGCILNAKPNLSAVIDQNNPGTDRFIFAGRTILPIPAAYLQTGNGQVK